MADPTGPIARRHSRLESEIFPWAPTVASIGVVLIGVTAIVAAVAPRWSAAAILIVGALAAWSVGGLIGFLFGVPPSAPQASRPRPDTKDETAGDPRSPSSNTALEEISSWLTRVIVGAGLVNIREFVGWLGRIGGELAAAVQAPGTVANAALGSAIIVYFATAGFMSVYPYARTIVAKLFAQSDRSIVGLFKELAAKQADETRRTVQEQGQAVAAQVQELRADQERALKEQTQLLLEKQMLAALYTPRPGGYRFALELGEQGARANSLTARAWYYLACAYGQRLRHERDLDEKERETIVNKAPTLYSQVRSREHLYRVPRVSRQSFQSFISAI